MVVELDVEPPVAELAAGSGEFPPPALLELDPHELWPPIEPVSPTDCVEEQSPEFDAKGVGLAPLFVPEFACTPGGVVSAQAATTATPSEQAIKPALIARRSLFRSLFMSWIH